MHLFILDINCSTGPQLPGKIIRDMISVSSIAATALSPMSVLNFPPNIYLSLTNHFSLRVADIRLLIGSASNMWPRKWFLQYPRSAAGSWHTAPFVRVAFFSPYLTYLSIFWSFDVTGLSVAQQPRSRLVHLRATWAAASLVALKVELSLETWTCWWTL